MTEEKNITYTTAREDVHQTEAPPIVAVLQVPKSWTRLVTATVTLLFIVVTIVAALGFYAWQTVQDNKLLIQALEERVKKVESEK
jgi:hypothetical protein